jgi:catechol 2,3-dioxygenase-like lactoylglutathione lyase family enzyme
MLYFMKKTALVVAAFLALGACVCPNLRADDTDFASVTIDLGCVVSDLDKALTFYKEAIGFTEVPGFSVPGDFASKVGLTNGKKLYVKVLILGEGEGATRLKVMHIEGTRSKQTDNSFIHSQLGFSYLTVRVKDTSQALARLEKAGVKPIARGAQELPASLGGGVYLTIVRDPDGNFIELVGPKS